MDYCVSASSSASVTNASNILFTQVPSATGNCNHKENEIRNRSLNFEIVPPLPTVPFVMTPLLDLIKSSYRNTSHGDSHVIYATSSIGKTTSCQAFLSKLLPKVPHSRGLMITSTSSEIYLTHLATVLGANKEEDVLADLVNGICTIKPSPAAVLILDEFNTCGPDNCNINLINILMRYIYQQQTGIVLYVVTQNKDVANKLCSLNEWQKIGPLQGLTNPSRRDVLLAVERLPISNGEIEWIKNDPSEWTLELLTKLVESRYENVNFDKTDDGVITWLRRGMTPLAALTIANEVLDKSSEQDYEGVLLL